MRLRSSKLRQLFTLYIPLIFLSTACAPPQALQYHQVKHFRITHLDLSQPEVGLDIQFYNPNSFNMELKDADIDVFVNNTYLGKARMLQHAAVPALDTFLLPVGLSADLKQLLPNALQLLSNQEVEVRISGFVSAGRGLFVKVPVNYTGKQKLNIF